MSEIIIDSANIGTYEVNDIYKGNEMLYTTKTIQEAWVDAGLATWFTEGKQIHYNTKATEVPLVSDFNILTVLRGTFINCSFIKTIPPLDITNVNSTMDLFFGCSKLETVSFLDMRGITNAFDMFGWCNNIITCYLENLGTSLNMQDCELLSLNSIKYIMDYSQYVTNATFTIKKSVWDKYNMSDSDDYIINFKAKGWQIILV